VRALPASDIGALASMAPSGSVGGPERSGQSSIASFLARFGAVDMLTLLCTDPSGVAVVVGTNLRRKRELSQKTKDLLGRLAAHTTTAFHLRGGDEAIDATFTREGRLLESSGDAKDAAAKLARTVRALTAVAGGDEAALARFTSRVDAQWSLLSKVRRGNEEFIVARRSVPPSWPLETLTQREREVVSHLAVGHSLKQVAYELGLAFATVRVLSARAAKKFGVASSRELAEKARTLLKR